MNDSEIVKLLHREVPAPDLLRGHELFHKRAEQLASRRRLAYLVGIVCIVFGVVLTVGLLSHQSNGQSQLDAVAPRVDPPPLPTLPQVFPSNLSAPVIEARLVYDVDHQCASLDLDGRKLQPRWPYGFTWTDDYGGVQSPDRSWSARIGDVIRVRGIMGQSGTVSVPIRVEATNAPGPGAGTSTICAADGETLTIVSVV